MNYKILINPKYFLITLLCLTVLTSMPNHATAKTLRIATITNFTSFDPTMAYEWLSYEILSTQCRFLITLEEVNNHYKPVLDIAKKLQYKNNNKTLIFVIKKGKKFHNGKEITAYDIAASLNRVTNPKLDSPGSAYFNIIQGYNKYQNKETKALTGVKVLDKYTLQIDLIRSSFSFLFVLSTNFSCIFPADTPIKKLTPPIVASGIYKFTKHDGPKLIIDLVGDNNSRAIASIYSQIEISTNLTTEDALAGYANKQYDVIIDGLDWAVTNNRKNWEKKKNRSLSTTYLTMNTKIFPFNQLRVRQAINYAINRDKLITLLSGAATKTTHIAPPGFLLYKKMKGIYHYNPTKARELLDDVKKEWSTSKKTQIDTIHVNLYAIDTKLYRKLVFSIMTDLQKVGINITPHFTSHKKVLEIAGRKIPGQMIFSGGLGWVADYPDISNFYTPLLSKNSISLNGWNWAHYSNKEVEKITHEADSLIKDQEKRMNLWVKALSIIEKEAPWAALYNRRNTNLFSSKITGESNLFVPTENTLAWFFIKK